MQQQMSQPMGANPDPMKAFKVSELSKHFFFKGDKPDDSSLAESFFLAFEKDVTRFETSGH